MKVVNLEEVKPPPEALELVPRTMAEATRSCRSRSKRTSPHRGHGRPEQPGGPRRPAQLPRHRRQGRRRLRAGRSRPGIEEAYAGKEGVDPRRHRADRGRQGPRQFANRNETSIDLDDIEEMADAAPVRKLINMVLLLAIQDHASDIHFEPFEDEYKMRYRVRRRALRDGAAAAPPRHRHRQPHQGHVEPRHRRAPAAAGRPHRAERRRQPGRHARQRPADHVRRERRHPRARPHRSSASTSNKIGMAAGHARRVPRGHQQAQRHRPGHRADRGRQDDDALLGPQRAERRSPTRSSPPRTRSSTRSTASSSARSTTRST